MTEPKTKSSEELALELELTRQKLDEAEETLRAISEGEVDAIVQKGVVFTLEGAEHTYRVIIETMNEAAVTTTADGMILFSNSRFIQLLRLNQEEVIGHNLEEFVASEQRDTLKKLLTKTPLKSRLLFSAKNGMQVPTYVSSNTFGPEIEGVCLVITDLTALEAASERLKRVEEQLYEVVDNTNVILWATDREGIVTLSEGRGLAAEGLVPGQIVGRPIFEMLDAEPIKKSLAAALKGKEVTSVFRSKSDRYYETRFTPVRGKAEEITGVMGISLDITDRVKAAEEIETLARIPDENPNPVIRCDKDGRVLYANDASKTMNQKWQLTQGEPLPDLLKKVALKSIKLNKPLTETVEAGEKIFNVHCAPVPERGYVNLYGRDITAEKKAEQILKENEQRLQILFDYAPDAYILVDREGRMIDSNRAADGLDGRPRAELLGKNILKEDIYSNSSKEKAAKLFKKVIAGQPVGPELLTIKHADGNDVIAEVRAYPVEIKGETTILTSARDVTERVRAAEELQMKTAQLEQFYDNTHILIALLDADFNFVRVNKAYAARENKPPKWFEGRNHFSIYPNSGNELIFKRVLETSKPYYVYAKPFVYPNKPEITTYWDWSLQPVVNGEGKVEGLIFCLIDATEEQTAIKALERSRQQMRALAARIEHAREEERTLISREIHDELGQILTGLRMDIAWLEQKTKDIKEEKVCSLFNNKLEQMTKTLFMTLETARKISRSLRPSVLDDLGLTAAIEWQAEEFQSRGGIKLDLDIQNIENVDRRIATAIFRIFQEALTNVARHAKATQVKVKLKQNKDNITLEVRDNGKGITEKELKHTESLGIVGMRERAIALDGEVQITSPGKGTLVKVVIPTSGGKEK